MSFKIAEDKHECTGKQECIPVGCVPPACLPYPSMHWAGGCISACTGQGGVCPWGVCPGVSAQMSVCLGMSAQEGCLPRRVVCPGVSAWGYLLEVVCLGGVCLGGVCPGGLCSGGVCSEGVCPGVCGRHPPCGQTDTCENITFTNFICRW